MPPRRSPLKLGALRGRRTPTPAEVGEWEERFGVDAPSPGLTVIRAGEQIPPPVLRTPTAVRPEAE